MPGSDHRLGAAGQTLVPGASRTRALWLARACIGLVFAWNVQSALAFLVAPAPYAAGFELAGAAGDAAVRGIGLLFLMWNVPYAVALWHPVRHRISLFEALAMQGIGLAGESLILVTLPAALQLARSSLARFVAFDAIGFLLLLLAVVLTNALSTGSSS